MKAICNVDASINTDPQAPADCREEAIQTDITFMHNIQKSSIQFNHVNPPNFVSSPYFQSKQYLIKPQQNSINRSSNYHKYLPPPRNLAHVNFTYSDSPKHRYLPSPSNQQPYSKIKTIIGIKNSPHSRIETLKLSIPQTNTIMIEQQVSEEVPDSLPKSSDNSEILQIKQNIKEKQDPKMIKISSEPQSESNSEYMSASEHYQNTNNNPIIQEKSEYKNKDRDQDQNQEQMDELQSQKQSQHHVNHDNYKNQESNFSQKSLSFQNNVPQLVESQILQHSAKKLSANHNDSLSLAIQQGDNGHPELLFLSSGKDNSELSWSNPNHIQKRTSSFTKKKFQQSIEIVQVSMQKSKLSSNQEAQQLISHLTESIKEINKSEKNQSQINSSHISSINRRSAIIVTPNNKNNSFVIAENNEEIGNNEEPLSSIGIKKEKLKVKKKMISDLGWMKRK